MGSANDKSTAGIAGPDAVRAPAVESDVVVQGVGFGQDFSRLLFGRWISYDQVDGFVLAEAADDFGVDPRNRFEFARPVAAVMGPGQPGRSVGLPLGGHAVTGMRSRRLHREGVEFLPTNRRLGELCSPWTGRRPVPTRFVATGSTKVNRSACL